MTESVANPDVLHTPAMPKQEEIPVCSDFDEDCAEVVDKVNCWLYAPECGTCPFLNRENK